MVVKGRRTRSNRAKLKQEKFQLDIRAGGVGGGGGGFSVRPVKCGTKQAVQRGTAAFILESLRPSWINP